MTSLSPTQCERLLDIYEQSVLVHSLYEQKEAAECSCQNAAEADSGEAVAQNTYKKVAAAYNTACDQLVEMYVEAHEEGIPIERLDFVTDHYLPHNLKLVAADAPS